MSLQNKEYFRKGVTIQKHSLFIRILEKVRVNDKGCWIFTGYVDNKTGYGQIRIRCFGRTRLFKVHRFVAYYIYDLDLFDLRLDVCHSCNTRNCVNPFHIWIGSRSENLEDASRKGRWHGGGGYFGPESKFNNLKEKDW